MLLVTALLLVTDGDEWKNVSHPILNPDGTRNRHSAPSSSSGSVIQRWRGALPSETSTVSSDSPTMSDNARPISPTTSTTTSSEGGRSDYPGTPASIPERPFRYDTDDAPPVPPVPVQYQQGWNALPASSETSYAGSIYAPSIAPSVSAASSSSARPRRELPMPPGITGRSDQPWLSHGHSSSMAPVPARVSMLSNSTASSSSPTASEYASSTSAHRGSFDTSRHPSSVHSPPQSGHPFAFVTSTGNLDVTNSRAYPPARPPPGGELPLPPKLAQEKQYQAPTRTESVTPRIRDSNFFGDVPGSRDTVFDLPPPAYDAIYHAPPLSAVSSTGGSYGGSTPSTTPTPWQTQFGQPYTSDGTAGGSPRQ
jgi:hypothetical protein